MKLPDEETFRYWGKLVDWVGHCVNSFPRRERPVVEVTEDDSSDVPDSEDNTSYEDEPSLQDN